MGTRDVHLTTHAISRFRERVRPGLAWEHAERELKILLELAEETAHAPAWLADRRRRASQRYLVLGDLAMPLAPSDVTPGRWLIVTCLTRGGIGDIARVARNARRQRRDRSSGRHRDASTRHARLERHRALSTT